MIENRFIARLYGTFERDARFLRLLALALAIRLVLMPWFSDPLNYYGFSLVASITTGGHNPYIASFEDPSRVDFSPWGYGAAYLLPALGASTFSFGNGYVFGLLIRLPLVACDLASGIVIYRIVRALGHDQPRARATGAAYLFNPFVIFVSAIWGTNDPVPVLFTLLSAYALIRSPRQLDVSALCLGLGIAFKIYPVVLLPMFLAAVPGWRARMKYLILSALPGALSSAPFLIASPRHYLATILLFGSSTDERGLIPYQSTWWFVAVNLGIRDPMLVLGGLVAFVGVVLILAVLVAKSRMRVLPAATLGLMLIFLVSPRLNQNYFLWMMPFVVLCAALEPWPRPVRWLAGALWVPLLVTPLLFNGARGLLGYQYWSLLTFGMPPPSGVVRAPVDWHPWLVMTILLSVAGLVGWILLKHRLPDGPPADPPPAVFERLCGRSEERTSLRLAAVAAAIFVFTSGAAFVAHQPVLPEDFGSYEVGNGHIRVTDDFRALLLGFTWRSYANGSISLDSTAPGFAVLDTEGAGRYAYIARAVPTLPGSVTMVVKVERVDGSPGFVQVARFAGGWLAVERLRGPSAGLYQLNYYDEVLDYPFGLRTVELGIPFSVSVTYTAEETLVVSGQATLHATARLPGGEVKFGHTDASAASGGRVLFDSIVLSWQDGSAGYSPALGAANAVLTAAVLLLPARIWWRGGRW